MKQNSFIIGLVLAIMMTINLGPPISYASEVQDACQNLKPKYNELQKLWDGAKSKDQKAYTKTFKAAQEAHHTYVGCLFDFAESKIMQSDGAEHSGTMSANIGNASRLPLYLGEAIDWMAPDQACLSRQQIKQAIEASEPVELLNPVLQAHTDYRTFLLALGNKYGQQGGVMDEDGEMVEGITALRLKSLEFDKLTRQRDLEIDSSLLAIDLMFTSLKELRLAFIMHVNLQCTLQYLDDYRRALSDLREIIEPLPNKLNDASSS